MPRLAKPCSGDHRIQAPNYFTLKHQHSISFFLASEAEYHEFSTGQDYTYAKKLLRIWPHIETTWFSKMFLNYSLKLHLLVANFTSKLVEI